MTPSVALESKPSTLTYRIGASRVAIVFAALLLATILFQILGNAYIAEFGAYPDESPHFMTGLMIRDYIAQGFPAPPVRFAENYYVHYPKIGFGMWGPLLHILEALWMLVFPPGHVSALVLIALISTTTATILFRTAAVEFGVPLALVGAFLFVTLPNVQTYTGMVMADGLVAVLDLCAVIAFARYLDTGRWKDSLWFGIFACLSILTKGNGIALSLLPAFAILLSGRFELIFRKSLWTALIPVIPIAVPWQYFSSKMLQGILETKPGWTYMRGFTLGVLTVLGIILIPVVALGVYDRLFGAAAHEGPVVKHGRAPKGIWVSAAALIFSFWGFHILVPSAGPEPRYLIAVTPPMILFLLAGIVKIAQLLPFPMGAHRRIWTVAGIVVAIFLTTGFSIPKKPHHGFDRAAQSLQKPEFKNSVMLISSEDDGEGMFISEMAIREQRPSHIILRATKMLSQSDWNRDRYKLLYATPEQVMKFLESVPVELVIIDNQSHLKPLPHHVLLKRTIASYPDLWRHVASFPQTADSISDIEVYQLKSAVGHPREKIRIELPYTLKRSIQQ